MKSVRQTPQKPLKVAEKKTDPQPFFFCVFSPEHQSNLSEFLIKLDQKWKPPGNNCIPLMNVHQKATLHLATDLNVILLSHRGTESRPWVAKGYSVANEVCTGPLG